MSPAASNDYDIFLAAAPSDEEAARAAAETLSGQGLRVFRPGQSPEDDEAAGRDLIDGLSRSRMLLAFYSDAFPRDRRCQQALICTMNVAQREDELARRIVVLTPEGSPDGVEPGDLRPIVTGRIPKPGNTRNLSALVRTMRTAVDAVPGPIGRIHPLTPPPWHGVQEVSHPRFVGRFSLLWSIHEHLKPAETLPPEGIVPPVVSLTGHAGAGKTQLARAYARRFGLDYPGGVFWLRAYGTEDPVTGMGPEERVAERDRQIREFAGALGVIIANRGPSEIRLALGDALGRRQRTCLWIVDDLPHGLEPDQVQDWIGPHPLARTIITSRERTLRSLGPSLDVPGLTAPEAADIAAATPHPVAPRDREALDGLVHRVGGHALSLDVALCTLAALHDRAAGTTLEDFDETDASVTAFSRELEGHVAEGTEGSIAAVLIRSVRAVGDETRDFLRLGSVLAAAPILPTLVSSVLTRVEDLDSESARDTINRAWSEADAHGLTASGGGAYRHRSIHPLIARTVRAVEPTPARLETLRAAAVEALREKVPARYDPSAYSALEFEITHARELVRHPHTIAEAELLGRIARYDLVRGAYESARGLYRRQVDAYIAIHGENHTDTATALSDLAGVMFLQGEIAEARRLHEQALEIRREALGNDHADTLTAMNNLATVLGLEGKLQAARQLQEEILEIRRESVGEAHADTLASMGNLAATLDAMGDLQGVRALQEQVLAARRDRFGVEHPATSSSAWQLYETLTHLRDEGAASTVLNDHLTWLLERDPGSLGPDQQNIRHLLTESRQV